SPQPQPASPPNCHSERSEEPAFSSPSPLVTSPIPAPHPAPTSPVCHPERSEGSHPIPASQPAPSPQPHPAAPPTSPRRPNPEALWLYCGDQKHSRPDSYLP